MKALLQRVNHASVSIEGQVVGEIGEGILLLLGIQKHDDRAIADKCLKKLFNYRIFSDADGKMNLSLNDIEGDLLIVSQFTLAADTAKGLRPGFSTAAAPDDAEKLYRYVVSQSRLLSSDTKSHIATGEFGANMQVSLENNGPVTFMLAF